MKRITEKGNRWPRRFRVSSSRISIFRYRFIVSVTEEFIGTAAGEQYTIGWGGARYRRIVFLKARCFDE